MKFEHKKILLRDGETTFLTLVPREGLAPDFACIAITSELRGKYYYFLKRPYKKLDNPYIFFEGQSLYIVKDGPQNKVYFFDKYSESNAYEFRKLFSICTYWQSVMKSFELLTTNIVFKKNYKGTGSFQDLSEKYEKFKFIDVLERSDYKLFEAVGKFIYFVNNAIINGNPDFLNISEFENLRYEVNNLYNEYIEKNIKKLTGYHKDFQIDKWTEWEEALLDWKELFSKVQENQGISGKRYLEEFLLLCKFRKLQETFYKYSGESEGELGTKIIENTINRTISSIGHRYGVEDKTIVTSLKKLFQVRSKKEVIRILENKIKEG
ncbi:hypothetical protein [Streptococcus ruminantium]|uniref:hypothetical protein n=1 Tax=Streptococcus ruminantium TaxID=1917441 RepID=UPI0012DC93EB|nr:hypothetical protein [Streptococcus ruminantium]